MRQLKSTKVVRRKLKDGTIKTYSYDAAKYRKQADKTEYSYSKKGAKVRQKYVITKGGKVNKAAIKRLAKRGLGSQYEVETQAKSFLARGYLKVSEQRFEASMLHNRIEGMFANCGMTVEEAAAQVGATVDQLYDESLWDGEVFNNPDGSVWMFTFNYDGSVWSQLN